jgi:hypothetical protein
MNTEFVSLTNSMGYTNTQQRDAEARRVIRTREAALRNLRLLARDDTDYELLADVLGLATEPQ